MLFFIDTATMGETADSQSRQRVKLSEFKIL
jgi:hypothetical protein